MFIFDLSETQNATRHTERFCFSNRPTTCGNQERQSKGAFAEELGIHKNSLGHYERGNRVPDAAVLLKLVEMGGFNANWVLTGEGGSKDAKESREALTQDIEKLRKLDEEFALIPGYNVQVAAGHGSLAGGDESPTRELAFRRKWLRYRGLHEHDLALVFAKGDSMDRQFLTTKP